MNLSPTPTPTVCGNCGAEERRLFHHVRHRGLFRRLCTSCVLRLHPQSFCPTCFLVYERSPPPSTDTVSCLECSSVSHSHCVGSANHAGNTYICPLCTSPNVPIFNAKKVKVEEGEGGGTNCREIDKKAAKVLFVAAKIAATSMTKAAVSARAEAEKRAKDAALTRKRAREALEQVAVLVAKEKLKRKEVVSVEVSGSGNVIARDRNQKVGNANLGGVANVAPVTEQNRIGPNEVSARLNAVGLREKDGLQGLWGQRAVSGPNNNGAAMAVEEGKERARVTPPNVGRALVQNNLGHFEKNNAQGEKGSNGLYSVPPVGDDLQHIENSHVKEETMGSQQ